MRYRVVLVEDNPSDVDVVKMAIAKTGLDVHLRVLTDGAAAMDFVHSLAKPNGGSVPDLMILDLSLPWATGDEVLRECRAHPKSAEVPVLLTSSAIGHPAYLSRMQAYGANRVFLKPMEMENFLQIGSIIRELLEDGGAKRAAATLRRTATKVHPAARHKLAKSKSEAVHRRF